MRYMNMVLLIVLLIAVAALFVSSVEAAEYEWVDYDPQGEVPDNVITSLSGGEGDPICIAPGGKKRKYRVGWLNTDEGTCVTAGRKDGVRVKKQKKGVQVLVHIWPDADNIDEVNENLEQLDDVMSDIQANHENLLDGTEIKDFSIGGFGNPGSGEWYKPPTVYEGTRCCSRTRNWKGGGTGLTDGLVSYHGVMWDSTYAILERAVETAREVRPTIVTAHALYFMPIENWNPSQAQTSQFPPLLSETCIAPADRGRKGPRVGWLNAQGGCVTAGRGQKTRVIETNVEVLVWTPGGRWDNMRDHLTNMSESFESYFKTCNGDPGAWTTGEYSNRTYDARSLPEGRDEELVVKIYAWSEEVTHLLEGACTAIPGSVSTRIETDIGARAFRNFWTVKNDSWKKREYILCENERGLRHGERNALPTLEWPADFKNPRWKK